MLYWPKWNYWDFWHFFHCAHSLIKRKWKPALQPLLFPLSEYIIGELTLHSHPPTNPEWETVNLKEGRRERLRLAQEWITSHLKSSHYVLKPEGSSVFLYDRTTSEMYCKIIRSKQAGKMSDALLFISWAGLVPATLQTAAVSVERVEVEINPICVFLPHSFTSPKTWWTIISAAEKRQNSTPSSSSLASHSIYIQV